jgi:hypothetical protein
MRKIFLLVALALSWSGAWGQVAAANPNAHLTAWYKCVGDAAATGTIPTTGTTVFDSSGFGNNGTYTGTQAGTTSGTYYSAGMVGPSACNFDGSTNFVKLATTNLSALNFGTNSFTVSFWMNPTTIPTSGNVVPLQFGTTGNTSEIFCQLKPSDGVSFLFCAVQDTNGVNGGGINTNLGLFVAGQPYMITLTMNRVSNIFSLYINGILAGTDSVPMTGTVDWSAPTASICVGGNGCSSNKFNGTINDVRVYNIALTSGQVADLHAADLAMNSTPQVVGQLASLSVSGTSATVVPTNFMGFSIEWTDIATIMGQASTGVDSIMRQLMTNLSSVSGGPVNIRVGGDSSDASTAVNTVEPEIEFLAATNTQFSLGVNLKTATLAQQEAEATAYIDGMPSAAIELGNEPDGYGITSATYLSEASSFWSAMHTSFPSTLFIGPSCITYFCNAMAMFPASVFSTGSPSGLTTGTVHAYQEAATSCTTSDCLLQPSAYLPSQPTYLSAQAVLAHASGFKFRVDEMNSASGGGISGQSNAFGSAIWLVANAMTMAANTVDGVNIHGSDSNVDGTFYDPFYITETNGTPNTFSVSISPIYYGMLFFDTATQNNTAIFPVTVTLNKKCSMSGWTACVQAWQTTDTTGNVRLSLVNLDENNSGNVVVSNAASTASVCYLSAPSFASKTGVTFAGQTFDGTTTGAIQGTASSTTLIPSGGVFTIPMAITQAAIVRFGVSSGC